MFDCYDPYQAIGNSRSNKIKIDVKLNKNSDISKEIYFSQGEIKNWNFVIEKIQGKIGITNVKPENVRIFNHQGLELFEQDLRFIANDDVVYVSRGEDFDIMSYYSEYEIISHLGDGGYGTVELGKHKKTGEMVAIKITKADTIDSAKDVYQVFSEAETLKNLKHPNIVTMQNCFMDKKTMQSYFIMEYLEGGELYEYIEENGKLSEEKTLHIFKQLISAIDYCHRSKIIHRDLKLENILRVSKESDLFKVVDFGIAGLSAGRKSEETNAGSWNYMAPEVHLGTNTHASPALDVFALGCIVYAMLTGNLPFDDKRTKELIKKICEEEVQFPPDLVLSDEIKDLIRRMLNKNPEERITVYEIERHPWFKGKKLPQNLIDKYRQDELDSILRRKPIVKIIEPSAKSKVKFKEPKKVPNYMKPKSVRKSREPNPGSRRRRNPKIKGVLKPYSKYKLSQSPSPRPKVKKRRPSTLKKKKKAARFE